MIVQLNPTLPVVTPKGKGEAVMVIDYSKEDDLYWVVIQQNCEIWTWRNSEIRAQKNITAGRTTQPTL